MTKKLTTLSLVLCLATLSAFGQASMTKTTISSAITSTDMVLTLASATGVSNANGSNPLTYLYIDREFMSVASVSGTTVQLLRRGEGGTGQTSHAANAVVWVGPPTYFSYGDPAGSCTSTNELALPRISVNTGNVWNCGNSLWTTFRDFADRLSVGANLSSATTIAPTNPVHHVTGTTDVVNITLPPACARTCQVILIPDGIFVTTTAGNIALASTSVVSKQLIMTYDSVTSKWYPSY